MSDYKDKSQKIIIEKTITVKEENNLLCGDSCKYKYGGRRCHINDDLLTPHDGIFRTSNCLQLEEMSHKNIKEIIKENQDFKSMEEKKEENKENVDIDNSLENVYVVRYYYRKIGDNQMHEKLVKSDSVKRIYEAYNNSNKVVIYDCYNLSQDILNRMKSIYTPEDLIIHNII